MMRRKRAKTEVSASGAGEAAPAVSNVRRMTWDELLARAEGDLDEKGREGYERSRVAAEKHVRRTKAAGAWFEVDVEGVRRVLVAYYEQVAGISDERPGFRKLFVSMGVRYDDYASGRKSHAEFSLVIDYIRRLRNELAKDEAEELVSDAQAAQKRLVTEEGCGLNQRAVELSLKATMKDVYGEGGGSGEADTKKSVAYIFPNMKATWIVAPSEIAAKRLEAKGAPEPEVVEVGP